MNGLLPRLPAGGSVGTWPGSPDRTAGRTGGKVRPPTGVLLLRLQQRSWGRPGSCGAPDVVPPPGLKQQNTRSLFHIRIITTGCPKKYSSY